ncbi:MAG: bifunctional diaminohydroxyphosphoribosylaminopyrimidine deaminase/5-amino-6-(5-phosphoribosylamino)uracil reductase RibD [Proteobacteria bacterium]|nr:MAG: bifunctional diaminohydroxyphosphoribosylaminopyrimidine deaminase/5-amino-6-(5-phosphoribosylamino)uracil reductase RibD [Pseudomonadota bacterium]
MKIQDAMKLALQAAREFEGATAPNPPVGAVVLDSEGNLLAQAAHERAGTAHAEKKALDYCREKGTIQLARTLVVTLEPCNHQGKTPPCTDAILRTSIKRVIYGAADPNPLASGGASRLRNSGLDVITGIESDACQELITPFAYRFKMKRPYLTLKTAHLPNGSMIPPEGTKTFTSPSSLRFAHILRKKSDAIITGSGTVLADLPLFTVRHVPDHPGKRRTLVVLDRRERIDAEWKKRAQELGFETLFPDSVEKALHELFKQGCLEALVEAGPTLTRSFLSLGYWDRHFKIIQTDTGNPEEIRVEHNDKPAAMEY